MQEITGKYEIFETLSVTVPFILTCFLLPDGSSLLGSIFTAIIASIAGFVFYILVIIVVGFIEERKKEKEDYVVPETRNHNR